MASDNEPEISCPHCDAQVTGAEVFDHNDGNINSVCPWCQEHVADDEWVAL